MFLKAGAGLYLLWRTSFLNFPVGEGDGDRVLHGLSKNHGKWGGNGHFLPKYNDLVYIETGHASKLLSLTDNSFCTVVEGMEIIESLFLKRFLIVTRLPEFLLRASLPYAHGTIEEQGYLIFNE